MKFTKYGIEAMGFKEFPETDVIEVHFGILKVYSIRGMLIKKDSEAKQSEVVSVSDRCSIVVGQSINAASRILTGDVFVDDEEKWLTEKEVSPPFLLIYFRESKPRKLIGGHRQEKDDYIITYDAFSEDEKEIKDWENDAVPNIVTSLTVLLSTLNRQVDLIPVERSVFGVTEEGQNLFDIKVTGNVNAYLSTSKSIEEINSSLEKSKDLISILTKDVCKNFFEAQNETDRMKKFLSYFQFLERYTHSTYQTLNYKKDIKGVINVPNRVNDSANKFFKRIFEDSKNLFQRFNWCSIFAWDNIKGNDVAEFHELKKVRDKLSHGEHIEEKDLPVEKAKELALKLLGTSET